MSEDIVEDVSSFRQRARAWATANLRPLDSQQLEIAFRTDLSEQEELADVVRERELQKFFFDAGFAGICVPPEYGGQGLTPDHQRAFNQALAGYEFPARHPSPPSHPVWPCSSSSARRSKSAARSRHA
jgi:alkylation response protein AidB-like acyl-CoA dehydrogenase